MIRKEGDERLVRFAVDRARGEAHLDPLAVASCKFRTRGSRLDMQIENQNEATAGRICQRTISTTWIRTTRTSGVRSNWPTAGM